MASLILTIGVLTVLYRYLPRLKVQLRDVVLGAVCAGVCWELSTHAFVWYVARVTDYSKVYSSMAAVLLLLIWSHFSALILIWGAELALDYSRFRKLHLAGSSASKGTRVRTSSGGSLVKVLWPEPDPFPVFVLLQMMVPCHQFEPP
jgi:uncharacterized BrkB/YihY/UPF0761 family membrane protein